ncbi:hypothetical protein m02_10550 [Bartonella bovis m02]|uniref:Right handed beta helix domain-containing protein n=1 Tax=Bartonella bovis m02 TaxID=1094492 RepID=N6VBW9_9HYPH|nr:hypothetical protein m02_10550 [Bartonella bovis m02]
MGKIEFTSGVGNGYGVGVGVSGGSAELMKVMIMGEGGTGVYMGSTETLKMTSVDISGFEKGVSVGGGKVEMNMGSITIKSGVGSGNYGVGVWGTADATLMGTKIKGDGKGMGMYATGTGKMLMMSDVRISGVGMGVDATKGNLVMHKGSVEFKGNYGIYLIRGNALLNDITITGPGDKSTGMYVGSSGKIIMKDVTMSRVGVGAWVTNGGAMWLGDTHLKDVQNGMIVTQGSTVGMEGGEITFKGSYGVYLDKGGAALKDVKMTYMGSNDAVDFMTVQGGKVIAKDIQIYGNGYGQGMKVTQRGHVVLIKPTYTNVDKGMTISEGAVRVFGGSVEFKGKYGVSLTRGIATLKGVKMTYKGSSSTADFMTVRGGKVMAESIQINGNGYGQGVKVNGGYVVLIRPSLNKVRTGVTIQNAEVTMISSSINFTGGYGVNLHVGKAILKSSRDKHTRVTIVQISLKLVVKVQSLFFSFEVFFVYVF